MIDTYKATEFHYAKDGLLLDLLKETVSLPPLPKDTIVYLDWENEIDTSYTVLLNRLRNLETAVGTFRLRRSMPHDTNERFFYFEFDQWIHIESILRLFNDIVNIGRCLHPGMDIVSKSFDFSEQLHTTIRITHEDNQIVVHTEEAIQNIKLWDQQGRLLATSQENSILHIPNYSAPVLLFIQITCADKTYLFKEILFFN